MLREYLTNIANAIRSKLGTTDKVNAQDFADKVNEVYDTGYEKGNLNQAYQFFGNYYSSPYNIPYGVTVLGIMKFCYYWGAKLEVVIPDTVTQMHNSVFQYCYNLKKVNVPPNLTMFGSSMFHTCESLETIIFNNVKEFMGMDSGKTYNCKVLKDVIIENGVIAQNWAFTYSPLSVESMKSIISHLKNFAGTENEGVYTIRFTDACWEALEADSTAPNGDTWKDYVESLGWLL